MPNSDDDNTQYNKDNNKDKTKDDVYNNTESKLLRQTNEEEKARKRTRGPYRKSSRSIVNTHDQG
jgi:hypothetical protein